MALGTEVGLSPDDFVTWGPSPPPQKWGAAPPQFSAHFYCGQTAGCIKMPLGMKVGLGPDDSVIDGNPAPLPKKGAEPLPQFSTHTIVAKRLGGSRWHLAWRWALIHATLC